MTTTDIAQTVLSMVLNAVAVAVVIVLRCKKLWENIFKTVAIAAAILQPQYYSRNYGCGLQFETIVLGVKGGSIYFVNIYHLNIHAIYTCVIPHIVFAIFNFYPFCDFSYYF